MYEHILIATDGSELAAKGVRHGLALAGPLGARVTVLTVSEPLQLQAAKQAVAAGVDDPVARYDQQIDDDMKDRFEPIERQAAERRIQIDLLHEIDQSPAQAILRTARLKGCDLIVMTSHGRHGAARLLLGSQTAAVLAHTTVPVLVVR
ncbi:MAG: universal stress protein [Rhizobiaceae bacterium]|jgi:nucleotide-binding universal stress UspA family protein